jgi:hypothetical protein
MMEAANASEKSVNVYQATRCNNPEDNHLYLSNNVARSEIVKQKGINASNLLSCFYW